MKSREWIIATGSATVAILAIAADYGRYLCSNCGDNPLSPIDVRNFVSTTVNLNGPKQWSANDTFSVCNGSICIMYFYVAGSGAVFSPVSKYPDPRVGYKGQGELQSFNQDYNWDVFGYSYGAGITTAMELTPGVVWLTGTVTVIDHGIVSGGGGGNGICNLGSCGTPILE